jgi:4,5-dihydroxyphthalate decarboxylase
MSNEVFLTIACGAYDRTAPLRDGRVRPVGTRVNMIDVPVQERFARMLRNAEFDAAEMSLSSYIIASSRGDDRFVGLPVFLSRAFRYNSIYVRADRPIIEAAELRGGRIGLPMFQQTAAVWVRGMLEDDHDVPVESVTWCSGSLGGLGGGERLTLELPERIRTERLKEGQSLVDSLRTGDLDAIITPSVPEAFRGPSASLKRLFPDYADRDRAYYQRTGVFPIMHLLVLRNDLYERHPWIASSLVDAFRRAKDMAIAGAEDLPYLLHTIPFVTPLLEEQRDLFGEDPWPYGLSANRHTLEVFLSYMKSQGLLHSEVTIDGLFAAPVG